MENIDGRIFELMSKMYNKMHEVKIKNIKGASNQKHLVPGVFLFVLFIN